MKYIKIQHSKKDPVVEGIEESKEDARGVVRMVAYGDVLVPASKIDGVMVIDHEDGPRFGDVGYVTADQYRCLVAETLAVRDSVGGMVDNGDDRLCRRGMYLRVLDIVRASKPVVATQASYVYDRLYSAAWVGVLHGIATWDSSRSTQHNVTAYFKHVNFWMSHYVGHEAVVLRGEAQGMLREAELAQREYYSGGYPALRSIAAAYGEAWSVCCRTPSVSDILSVLEDQGKKRQKSLVERYIAEMYGANCLDGESAIHGEFRDDILATHRAIRGDAPSLIGASPHFVFDDVEAFEILYLLREQLFAAIAADVRLTPLMAEIIDVMFFSSLALEDVAYTEDIQCLFTREKLSAIRAKDVSKTIKNPHIAARALERAGEIEETKKLNVCIVIPDLDRRGSKPGVKCCISAPRTYCGDLDRDAVQHLSGFVSRNYSCRVALRVASRHAFPRGPRHVTNKDFSSVLKVVKATREAIRKRGYLDPASRGALPIIREMYYLDNGWVPAAQYTAQRDPLYTRSVDGKISPLMVWVRPKVVKRRAYSHVCGYTRVDVGSAIETLRQRKIEGERCAKLCEAGRMEVRQVLVRCLASEGTVSVTQRKKTQWKTLETVRWYRPVDRALPIGVKIGDARRKHTNEMVDNYMDSVDDLPKKPLTISRAKNNQNENRNSVDTSERGAYSSYDARSSIMRVDRDYVRFVSQVQHDSVDSTGLILGLSVSEFSARIVRALRGTLKTTIRSNEIRNI